MGVPKTAHATPGPRRQPLQPDGGMSSPPCLGGLKCSPLALLPPSRGPSWPHLVDVKADGQILTLAVPAGRLLRPLLDADQHFILGLLDIKDVLRGPPRHRDTAVRPPGTGALAPRSWAGARPLLDGESPGESRHLSGPRSLIYDPGLRGPLCVWGGRGWVTSRMLSSEPACHLCQTKARQT